MAEGMSKFMESLDDWMKNTKIGPEIRYPIEVSAVKISSLKRSDKEIGSWVSVRPCAEEYANKTFLGIYLGDLLSSGCESYNIQTKEISVLLNTNPAIYVPDLKKVIWGMESWWGIIDSPEKMRRITDADIENAWYVRAMKDLSSVTE